MRDILSHKRTEGCRLRERLLKATVLLVFLLVPTWLRFAAPTVIAPLYVSRFALFQLILVLLILWVGLRLTGLRALLRDDRRSAWLFFLLMLALWGLLSNLWAFQRERHPEVALTASVQFAMVGLFVVMLMAIRPSPHIVAVALIAGLTWNCVLVYLQVAAQGTIGLKALGEFSLNVTQPGASVLLAGELRWFRPYGLLPHPNMLGGFFAMALPVALVLALSTRRWVRWLGLILLCGGLFAIGLTFSRAAWGGLAVAVFVMLPLLWRGPLRTQGMVRRILVIVCAVLVTTGIFAAAYAPLLAARAGVGSERVELRSINDRAVFNTFAGRAIVERPIAGVGMGNFPWRTSYYLLETDFDLRGDNVHHVMLSAWAELGTIGFVLLILTLMLGMEGVLRGFRGAAPDPLRVAFLGGFMALTAIGLLDHYPWTQFPFQIAWWGLLAMAWTPPNSPLTSPEPDSVL